ncbi:MAG: thiol-disulfide isomerase/thioredoxin [Planctomycetota bacterium]|jgi:thiol-disulfide isomerase/thioredoxin
MNFKIGVVLFFMFLSVEGIGQVKTYEKFTEFEQDYLKDLSEDTIYVVNFWATWCAPCVAELPFFEALNTKHKGNNVKVVLVSIDSHKNLESKVIPFLAKKGFQTEVVLLADSKTYKWIDLIDPSWSGAIPITLILSGNEKHFYEKDYESLEALEEDVLKIKQ